MRIEATQQTTTTAKVTGAIQQAAKATGTSFQYLLATAKVESNLNPNARGENLLGRRAVSIHRADLARHHERGGRVVRLCRLRQRDFPQRVRPLCGGRSGDEGRDPGVAAGPDRQFADGRRADQEQRRRAVAKARPRADRRRTLHGAFSRRQGRRETDRPVRAEARHERGCRFSQARRARTARSFSTRTGVRAMSRKCPRNCPAGFRSRARKCRRQRPRRPLRKLRPSHPLRQRGRSRSRRRRRAL